MTSERGRSSGSADGARALPAGLRALFTAMLGAAVVALAAWAASPPCPAVEEEDITAILAEHRKTLEEGSARLASLDFAEAIDAFTRLIDAYKTGRIPMVTPDARLLVAKSYEGRALALANLGRNADASADFETLIRFDPTYVIDLKGISSKIVTLYSGVRKRTIGVLNVEGDPLGAEVFLDDQSLGPSPVVDREVVAGTYRLRISRSSYDSLEEEIQVEAGGKTARKYRLVPNARGILVATVPRDVKVVLDGRERGSTFGTAGTAYREVAAEMGLNLEDVSEPLLVENLGPGEHEMILQKECFQEVLVRIPIEVDPNNNAPISYKPFVLERSRGRIEVTSDPPGARVSLDGRPSGETPVVLEDVCSGTHDLLLEREGIGRAAGTVDVRRDQTAKASYTLRISLAAFDLRSGLDEGESLGACLADLERYNVVSGKNGIPGDILERVRLEVESSQGRGLSQSTLAGLFTTLKVELIGLAVPVGALGDQVDFLLYGPSHPAPDRVRLEGVALDKFRRIKQALDAGPAVEMAWSGLKLYDVFGKKGAVVLSVTAGSPAEAAGIKQGDLVVAAGESAITSAGDFQAVLGRAAIGEETTIGVESGGKLREAGMRFLATPVLLPIKGRGLLYNKVIADLAQAISSTPDASRKAYLWLNTGVALMHFGQWEAALRDAFRKANLPEGAGISRGTVRYLMGICYEKLGMGKEARAAYDDAAASSGATLGSNDGPALAGSARRRASGLGSS